MKLGVFSFGGGAVTLSLLKNELVDKRKWINDDELVELTAIAESTPGPIAINLATYLGYQRCGVLGSVFATLGMVLPSFIIMLVLSIVFGFLWKYDIVQYIFMGVKCGVIFLILGVGISMIKGLGKKPLPIILFSLVLIGMILTNFLVPGFSSIYFILFGAVLGLLVYIFSLLKGKKGASK